MTVRELEELKVGDKVKYINKENEWFGKIGKVISVYVSTCFVNFDDEIVECYKENLEKVEDKQKKYIIWNPKGKNPKHIHNDILLAENEAERLAKENPNQEFYILEIVKKAKGTVKVEWE